MHPKRRPLLKITTTSFWTRRTWVLAKARRRSVADFVCIYIIIVRYGSASHWEEELGSGIRGQNPRSGWGEHLHSWFKVSLGCQVLLLVLWLDVFAHICMFEHQSSLRLQPLNLYLCLPWLDPLLQCLCLHVLLCLQLIHPSLDLLTSDLPPSILLLLL